MIIGFFAEGSIEPALFREWIASYTIQRDLEFDVLYFSGSSTLKALDRYAAAIDFAIISLDKEDGYEIGRKLAIYNPCCYICYCSQGKKYEPAALLRSRPFEYFHRHESIGDLTEIMDAMLSHYIESKSVFLYESRRETLYYPIKNILYFQSDLKHVLVKRGINRKTGEAAPSGEDRIYAKLSDLEASIHQQNTGHVFLRIHKSYLVNMMFITKIDKQQHTVHLVSGEDLPISEFYYKSVCEKLGAFHNGEKSLELLRYDP